MGCAAGRGGRLALPRRWCLFRQLGMLEASSRGMKAPATPFPSPLPHLKSSRALGGGGPATSPGSGWAPAPRPLPHPLQCSWERRACQMAWLRMRRRCREVRAGTGDMRLRALWCHEGGAGEGR